MQPSRYFTSVTVIRKRLLTAVAALAGLLLISTTGYVLIERASPIDALYMVLITISTVGFGEVWPLSTAGKIWTMLTIMVGLIIASLTFSMLVTLLVSDEVRNLLGRRKLQAKIAQIRDHVIICGCGRMGRIIRSELAARGVQTVVIEVDPQKTAAMSEHGILYVLGDASEEETLLEAGLMRAKALVSVLPHDSDNVYVVLTARALKPDLFIIARSEQAATEHKLLRAGADKVISPQTIGAMRVANLITRPNVVDFFDVAAKGVELEMDEYIVRPDSPLKGKTLKDSGLRQKARAMVVAIKRADGTTVFNPDANEIILENDTLILIGPAGVSSRLEALT